MTRDEYVEALAVQMFKKASHIDPSDDNDWDAADFGWSEQDEETKDYYLSIADYLYGWLCTNLPPDTARTTPDLSAYKAAIAVEMKRQLPEHVAKHVDAFLDIENDGLVKAAFDRGFTPAVAADYLMSMRGQSELSGEWSPSERKHQST